MKKTILLSLLGCTLVGSLVYLTQFKSNADFSSIADRTIAGPQKNICSITINSADEINMFKQKLSSDGRFKFTELTNSGDKWFDRACASKVQCDVLVISGHFGGYFFGDTGYHLTLAELETQSCSKNCTGILEQPKEIYLFGCNTLASKGTSTRTPAQYLQVLLEDGVERSFAERVVESRYGASGEQNINRMKRAFPGVPVIYGFCDKAPLGAEAGPIMKAYLAGKSKDDYYDRLNRLENIRNTMQPYSPATIQQLIDVPLATAFKNIDRCFSQITGVDTKDDTAKRICIIRDVTNSIEVRGNNLDFLMRTNESLSYIELCNDFFNEVSKKSLTPSELAVIARIKNNQKLRDDIEILLDKVSFFLAFDYGILGERLGLSKAKVNPILVKRFVDIVKKGLTEEEINMMINVDFKNSFKDYIAINYNLIDAEKTWSNANSIEAIGLTKTQDPAILARLQQMLPTAPRAMQRQLIETLIRLNGVTLQMKDSLVPMLYDNHPLIRSNAIRALGTIKVYDERVMSEVVALMNRETDSWTLKKSALYFVDVPFDDPAIQTHLAQMISHKNPEVRQYSAQALANRVVKDRAVMEALIGGFKDTNGEAKLNCQFALKRNRQNIPPDLANLIQSQYPEEYKYIFMK